jgi:hypothetical protein
MILQRTTPRAGGPTSRRAAAVALFVAALPLSLHAAAQPASAPRPAPAAAPRPAPAAASPSAPAAAPPSAPPLAQALTGAARAEYEAGRILFNDGDYENAVIKFGRAYELSKEPRLLWNVALCQKNLKRYTRMLATVQKLLDDGGPLLSEQDRADAAELVQTIQAFVSRLELTASEEGAAVFVDDEQVGTTPLKAPALLDVGARRIRVSKKGFKDFMTVQQVEGGGAVHVSAALEKEVHRGRLAVSTGPEGLIALDGKVVGRATWEGSVPSGGHTLRVTAPGMKTHQAEVMVADGQTRRLEVILTPQPKDGAIERWLWIGGGAALLAGAIVGAAFLYEPEPPVAGNASPGSIRIAAPGGRGGPAVGLSFGGAR